MRCDTCQAPHAVATTVHLCAACAASMAQTPLSRTAEFDISNLAAEVAELATPAPAVGGSSSCTWCRKAEASVRRLCGQPGAMICNECIAFACMMLDAELGTWR